MSDIPEWSEAVTAFRAFLEGCGQPGDVRWVFRDDLFQSDPLRIFVRAPLPDDNEALAVKVFAEGRREGLVEIVGLAGSSATVLATVWYPKRPGEEVQGWSGGMKLSLRSPLPRAVTMSSLTWAVTRCLPSYRRFQRAQGFVGTREWAAA